MPLCPRHFDGVFQRRQTAGKPILAHLNTEALRQDSASVEVESTLTAFVKRLYDPLRDGRTPNGRQIREFKNQLSRLSGSNVT
jgi:hypothetical protein